MKKIILLLIVLIIACTPSIWVMVECEIIPPTSTVQETVYTHALVIDPGYPRYGEEIWVRGYYGEIGDTTRIPMPIFEDANETQ